MKFQVCLLFLLLPTCIFSQMLHRKKLDYTKVAKDYDICDTTMMKSIERAYQDIENNKSNQAVMAGKKIYESYNAKGKCANVFELYGYALFRNGKWLEGVKIIEDGISKFGMVPALLTRRARMSLEMAHLGIGQKDIDGSSVYLATKDKLKFDEAQFKKENLESALADLTYIIQTYQDLYKEMYLVAKIHQELKQYDQSTKVFQRLLSNEEYAANAQFDIAENLIQTQKYEEAEKQLLALEKDHPGIPIIYEKLVDLYTITKEEDKQKTASQKAIFYQYVPNFLDFEYSKENMQVIEFFGKSSNSAGDKKMKLAQIEQKENQDYLIDICLIVLKMHANHGNGIEDKAAEMLAKIGQPAIEKTHKLFQSDISTCTITLLAKVMAAVKDEKSWELLVEYLPYIANMPITLTAPELPAQLIAFDEEKGITEILKVVKPLLSQKTETDDAMSEFAGFKLYVYYEPLTKIDQSRILAIAKKLNYSSVEINKLKEKIKK